jgi:hypothetical protein
VDLWPGAIMSHGADVATRVTRDAQTVANRTSLGLAPGDVYASKGRITWQVAICRLGDVEIRSESIWDATKPRIESDIIKGMFGGFVSHARFHES